MACPLSLELHEWVRDHVLQSQTLGWLTTAGTSFVLIGAAEIGDKSQLVCMTLSARHRGLPVLLGALAAFSVLNLVAVAFGVAIAHWVPRMVLLLGVATLFALFGCLALFTRQDEAGENVASMTGHGVFVTTFLMIVLAEFGDKTQLATAALSVGGALLPVWVGATLALGLTSALGVYAGRTLLQRIPLHLLHRVSGLMFLALAGYTLAGVFSAGAVSEWLHRALAALRGN